MLVPSIAPITLGKPLLSSNPRITVAALSPVGHCMNKGARLNNARVTLRTALTAVARPTLNRSQTDLQSVYWKTKGEI